MCMLLQGFEGGDCRDDEFCVLLEELVPSGPVRFASIGDWRVASAVAHVQQVWAFGQDQFDQFKVWLACPSSIVENSSAVVVSHLDRYIGLMHKEGDNIKKSSAACHMQKALAELVAAF